MVSYASALEEILLESSVGMVNQCSLTTDFKHRFYNSEAIQEGSPLVMCSTKEKPCS